MKSLGDTDMDALMAKPERALILMDQGLTARQAIATIREWTAANKIKALTLAGGGTASSGGDKS